MASIYIDSFGHAWLHAFGAALHLVELSGERACVRVLQYLSFWYFSILHTF